MHATVLDVPVINVEAYLNGTDAAQEECKKVAESLHKYGILVFSDPRVKHEHNSEYIDLMEKYFEQAGEKYYKGEAVDDIRKDIHF